MKVKDQITFRREALGMTMKELADRVGVTEQAVRHWESGRSFPGKTKMRLVEQALSFSIDWTEGASPAPGQGQTAAAMIDPADVDLLLVLCRLPLDVKSMLGDLARTHLAALERARGMQPQAQPAPATQPAPAPQKTATSKATAAAKRPAARA